MDADFLSLITTAGDTLADFSSPFGDTNMTVTRVRLKAATQAKQKPDYTGNNMGMYKAGEYTIYNTSDKCYAFNPAQNHWILQSACEVIAATDPTPDPQPTGEPVQLVMLRDNLPPRVFDLTEIK